MRQIWKYQLNVLEPTDPKFIQHIKMPDANILDVQVQNGILCLWATVNPESEPTLHKFEVFGTGWPMDKTPRAHVGTVQMGQYVWHVFERYDP